MFHSVQKPVNISHKGLYMGLIYKIQFASIFFILSSLSFANPQTNKKSKTKSQEVVSSPSGASSVNDEDKKIYKIKNCKVEFSTIGSPTLIKITGKSNKNCEGSITLSKEGNVLQSEFKMNLSDIETGIPLRNRHLRENYLNTEKFPEATLKIISLQDFKNQISNNAKVKSAFAADLTLKGKSSHIQDGQYQIHSSKNSSKEWMLESEFSIDLPHYDIERPAFMGVKIVDKVNLTVKFEFE